MEEIPAPSRGLSAGAALSPPSAAVIALNRLAYGPRPGDLEDFQSLGATDGERLRRYLQGQLNPQDIEDDELEERLAAADFRTLDKSLARLWQDHVVPDPDYEIRLQPLHETELATFLRALYSRRQLFEVMVEFWHNHFSIYGQEWEIGPIWPSYDRDVIRAHALGNFRQLLTATARSPAMMIYLDNYENSKDGPNENYARELFELHTLGAEHYFGVRPREDVPKDAEGRPLGFVDEDLFAATRALTGWTVRNRPWDPEFGDTGAFFLYAPWHDQQPKSFLGVDLPAGQSAAADGQALLDTLAAHPGPSKFIARKLCRRLLGDFPPPAVIDAAAATFRAHADHPRQIAKVVETIVLSQAFLSQWGEKIKRPFEIVTSALRATQGSLEFRLQDDATNIFGWLFYQTGHQLFGWAPPNGYPDLRAAWQSTTPRVMTWRLLNWLVDARTEDSRWLVDALAQTPRRLRSAEALVGFWEKRIFGRALAPEVRQEFVGFMAQGHLPHLDLPLDSDEDTRSRLQALLGLMLMSPDFLWR